MLPGAVVTAIHIDTGFRIERTADGAGRFFLAPLPVGRYDITVVLSGFKPAMHRDIIVLGR